MYDDKNTARMMVDPNRAFKRPMDVVEAEDIGVAEKLAALAHLKDVEEVTRFHCEKVL